MDQPTSPQQVMPFLALPFHMTVMGHPRVPGKVWDPAIGAGPFLVEYVPKDVPLSNAVKATLILLAEEDPTLKASLKEYVGFGDDGRLEPEKTYKSLIHQFRACGHTIHDANKRLLVLHGQKMRGNEPEDQQLECGSTTEKTFRNQGKMTQQWWNRILYGANTASQDKAVEFAMRWMKTLDPASPTHKEEVANYDELMFHEACRRHNDDAVSDRENIWIQCEVGDGSNASSLGDANSSSDDATSSDSDIDINSSAAKEKIASAKARTIKRREATNALIERMNARRAQEHKENQKAARNAQAVGAWMAKSDVIRADMQAMATTGQYIQTRAERKTFYDALEQRVLEDLYHIKRKLRILSTEDREA
ncbi:hypothetical protein V490_07276 [Pseudogymnoascus sp. VKM F-3557]|nr:hypothetical protein V490_07276 [Pseudogymnoascus sp. VKM F-3557]